MSKMTLSSVRQWITRVRNSPAFGRYLLLTNTVSYCSLLGLGDIVVQTLERYHYLRYETEEGVIPTDAVKAPAHSGKLHHDWARTGRMFALGLLAGPLNHGFYTIMDRYLPGRTADVVVKKVLTDQIIGSPFFAFTFFMGMGTLEGKTQKDSFTEFKAKFWAVYKADWTLWPAAQAINFAFVPPNFRVIYIAVVTLGWNSFLSYMKHSDEAEWTTDSTGGLGPLSPADIEMQNQGSHSRVTISSGMHGSSGIPTAVCDDHNKKSSTVVIPRSSIPTVTATS